MSSPKCSATIDCKIDEFNRRQTSPETEDILISYPRMTMSSLFWEPAFVYETNIEMHQFYEQSKWSIPLDSKTVIFN